LKARGGTIRVEPGSGGGNPMVGIIEWGITVGGAVVITLEAVVVIIVGEVCTGA